MVIVGASSFAATHLGVVSYERKRSAEVQVTLFGLTMIIGLPVHYFAN